MTITLARIEDSQGRTQPGSKGLTCFFMRVKQDDGTLNSIRIHKLKNKLGTKQLPTAELELAGSVAYRLSDPGRGVSLITTLVNVTRLYNAVASIGGMRRMVALMRDYAHRRIVFGGTLAQNAMHLETMAEVEVQLRAATIFTFDVAERLGRAEIPALATKEDQTMLRLLTPLVKLYTAKQAVALASEGLESFGGQGYIEDSKLPRLLRDAQVLPIWEGTTNVLSHDLLRVLATSKGQAWTTFKQVVAQRIADIEPALAKMDKDMAGRITKTVASLRASLAELEQFLTSCLGGGDPKAGLHTLEMHARTLAFAMSRIYMASGLSVHALHTGQHLDWVVLERWVADGDQRQSTATSALVPNQLRDAVKVAKTRADESRMLALDIDTNTKKPRGCGNLNVDGTPRSKL